MKNFNEKGITLIALVVTIIILIILAGISISTLTGKNGILSRATEAQNLTRISNEKEALELACTLASMENSLDSSNQYFIGKKLSNPKLDNVNWDMIVINDSQKKYGDSWNFIAKNTDISNYGLANYNWLVNYNSGEIIKLEENSFTELSSKTGLAITDGLLFNIDAANISSDDISTWGDNVRLYYFDDSTYDTYDKRTTAYTEQIPYVDVSKFSGYDRQVSSNAKNYIDLDKNAFKFNGNNYIEIYNKDGFDFSDGFTFEFYGNLSDLSSSFYQSAFVPFLGLWSGNFNSQCSSRFGYLYDKTKLHYSLVLKDPDECGSWPEVDNPHNQQYNISDLLTNDIYLTLVFVPSKSGNATQSIYINGNLLATGWLTNTYYNQFITAAKSLNYIELGRCTMSKNGNWCYSKGLCYTSRLYNKALSSDEVLQNATKTMAYHNALEK